jgi:mannose/fructose/N-acetylgalactosamine-specific phosphotransferase system component IID
MLEKTYRGEKDRFLASLKRHIGFFNTHIFFSSAVLGVMVRLEEEFPNDDPKRKEDEIESAKMGMMGPLAAIGDALFWSGLKPLALLTGVAIVWLTNFSTAGWIAGAVSSLVIYNAPRVIIKYFLLIKAYFHYKDLFVLIQKVKFQSIMKSIKVAGMGLLGASMAVYFMKKPLTVISSRKLDSLLLFIAFWIFTAALRKKSPVIYIFGFSIFISIIIAYII